MDCLKHCPIKTKIRTFPSEKMRHRQQSPAFGQLGVGIAGDGDLNRFYRFVHLHW
jgi:hypothetical protein